MNFFTSRKTTRSTSDGLSCFVLVTESEADFTDRISRYAASLIMSVAYGRRIDTVDDWIVTENVASVSCASFLESALLVKY